MVVITSSSSYNKMAHGASAEATNECVRAIMMAKSLKTLPGHPNTENVDHLEEQIGKTLFLCTHHSVGMAAMDASPWP